LILNRPILLYFHIIYIYDMSVAIDAHELREYLHSIKDDWNYITPMDFYNEYVVKKKGLLLD
jgi:hypothetical protein